MQWIQKHLYGTLFCALMVAVLTAMLLELPPLYRQGIASTNHSGVSFSDDSALETEDKIDVNTAVCAELEMLDGIGKTKANAIVFYREHNGPFQSVEELMRVPGISDGLLSKIKDQITVT